ncbi:MFS transporter [Phycicoccus sp. BSK3Z-2]|uniref:MFS transporter n=1 Tax=Phycicoccus avicenniae TaxID=2828860 RepID=A0A941HZ48_9MICO|nr:MFS transporter [Phycicoccus avicenniae]MBR7741844.1 MFS transporter [Phycicoccus avicenniae]
MPHSTPATNRTGTTAATAHERTTATAGRPGRLVIGTLLAASTLTIMAAAVISPSLPALGPALGSGSDDGVLVRLALTITSLGIALTAVVVGSASDRLGPVPVLLGSLALYAVAGVAGAFAPSLAVLLVTRVLLGIGVGGVMTSISTLITREFDGEERRRYIGLQQTFASLGGVVFLPLAGWLSTIAWNAPFWIYAAAAAVLPFAAVAFRSRQRPAPSATPPRPGSGAPMPQRAVHQVLGILVVAGVGTLVFFMAPTQLPFLLADRGASATLIGIVVAASTASSAVAAALFPQVRRHLDQVGVTAVSLVLLGLGWVVVGMTSFTAVLFIGVLVGGLGVGLVVPTLNLWIVDLVPAERRGRALGGLVSAIFLGQFLSPLVLAPLVSRIGVADAFAVSGALTVVVVLLGLGAHRLRRPISMTPRP